MFKKILVYFFALFLSACSSYNDQLNDALSNKSNLKEAFIEIIKDTYGSIEQMSAAIVGDDFYKVNETNSYTVITANNVNQITFNEVNSVIYQLCKNVRGEMFNSACLLPSNKEHLLFFAKLTKTSIVINEKSYRTSSGIDFYIVIPKQDGQKETLSLVNKKGYFSPAQIKEKKKLDQLEYEKWQKKEKLKKEKILLAKKAQEEKEEIALEHRKELSRDTRKQVLIKGTRICSVYDKYSNLEYFTEDSSHGKIKINIGNSVVWDWAENWYACDLKPE